MYLDSYPFGGCSSIIDALLVHQPVVSLSGTKYSNRCGPHLLETAGLTTGVVHNERDYFRTTVRDNMCINVLSRTTVRLDSPVGCFRVVSHSATHCSAPIGHPSIHPCVCVCVCVCLCVCVCVHRGLLASDFWLLLWAGQVRMIGDERFRVEQKAKMIGLDLDALFFDRQSPREQDYVAAFRFLFSQHDALISEGSTTPLRVPELCAQGAYARAC